MGLEMELIKTISTMRFLSQIACVAAPKQATNSICIVEEIINVCVMT